MRKKRKLEFNLNMILEILNLPIDKELKRKLVSIDEETRVKKEILKKI